MVSDVARADVQVLAQLVEDRADAGLDQLQIALASQKHMDHDDLSFGCELAGLANDFACASLTDKPGLVQRKQLLAALNGSAAPAEVSDSIAW